MYTEIIPLSLEKLTNAFRAIIKSGSSKNMTIRILDFQPDKKPFPFRCCAYDKSKWYIENPIGRQVIIQQLRALLRVYTEGFMYFKVEFPMVETEEDLLAIGELLKVALKRENISGKIFDLGIMVETKEAVERLEGLLRQGIAGRAISFVSLGTNDLTKSFYEIDRSEAAQYNEYFGSVRPVILKAVLDVAFKANRNDVESILCGDLANRRRLWIVWYYLQKISQEKADIRLSMSAPMVARFKAFIKNLDEMIQEKRDASFNDAFDYIKETVLLPYEEIDERKDQLNEKLQSAVNRVESYIREKIRLEEEIVSSFQGRVSDKDRDDYNARIRQAEADGRLMDVKDSEVIAQAKDLIGANYEVELPTETGRVKVLNWIEGKKIYVIYESDLSPPDAVVFGNEIYLFLEEADFNPTQVATILVHEAVENSLVDNDTSDEEALKAHEFAQKAHESFVVELAGREENEIDMTDVPFEVGTEEFGYVFAHRVNEKFGFKPSADEASLFTVAGGEESAAASFDKILRHPLLKFMIIGVIILMNLFGGVGNLLAQNSQDLITGGNNTVISPLSQRASLFTVAGGEESAAASLNLVSEKDSLNILVRSTQEDLRYWRNIEKLVERNAFSEITETPDSMVTRLVGEIKQDLLAQEQVQADSTENTRLRVQKELDQLNASKKGLITLKANLEAQNDSLRAKIVMIPESSDSVNVDYAALKQRAQDEVNKWQQIIVHLTNKNYEITTTDTLLTAEINNRAKALENAIGQAEDRYNEAVNDLKEIEKEQNNLDVLRKQQEAQDLVLKKALETIIINENSIKEIDNQITIANDSITRLEELLRNVDKDEIVIVADENLVRQAQNRTTQIIEGLENNVRDYTNRITELRGLTNNAQEELRKYTEIRRLVDLGQFDKVVPSDSTLVNIISQIKQKMADDEKVAKDSINARRNEAQQGLGIAQNYKTTLDSLRRDYERADARVRNFIRTELQDTSSVDLDNLLTRLTAQQRTSQDDYRYWQGVRDSLAQGNYDMAVRDSALANELLSRRLAITNTHAIADSNYTAIFNQVNELNNGKVHLEDLKKQIESVFERLRTLKIARFTTEDITVEDIDREINRIDGLRQTTERQQQVIETIDLALENPALDSLDVATIPDNNLKKNVVNILENKAQAQKIISELLGQYRDDLTSLTTNRNALEVVRKDLEAIRVIFETTVTTDAENNRSYLRKINDLLNRVNAELSRKQNELREWERIKTALRANNYDIRVDHAGLREELARIRRATENALRIANNEFERAQRELNKSERLLREFTQLKSDLEREQNKARIILN
ncbi:MAG TPA: hypothetical protein PKH98_01605, partial [Candidatus Omnitrophota bacterium]|nr:hypothetical protein [Candidatus Omnitrophota bacterium]